MVQQRKKPLAHDCVDGYADIIYVCSMLIPTRAKMVSDKNIGIYLVDASFFSLIFFDLFARVRY